MEKIKMQPTRPEDALLTDAFADFLEKCRAKNLSEKTLNIYTVHFKFFKEYLSDPDKKASDITEDTLEGFILYLQNRGCNDITVQSYMRGVRCLCYYLMEEGYLQRFKIKLPKADKRIKETYTDTELKKLLKKPNVKTCEFNEYKTWVFSNYLLATGNRISTVLSLQIKDLDFENETIQLNKCKNRKAQIVPMASSLKVILKEYLTYRKGSPDDYVFCNSYGGKGDIRSYQEMLAKYNQKFLLKVYLVTCFNPDITFPSVSINGTNGSGKSTLSRIIKKIIDPSSNELETLPDTIDDLRVRLNQDYYLAFDNLSSISKKQSDFLCAAITGVTSSNRMKYTDNTINSVYIKRGMCLNGISPFVQKADLAERVLFFTAKLIKDTSRISDMTFWKDFSADLPYILGGIFDLYSKAMKILPTVKLQKLQRLADFHLFGYAVAEAMKRGLGKKFNEVLEDNKTRQMEITCQNAMIISLVEDFLKNEEDEGYWKGTMSLLYKSLKDFMSQQNMTEEIYNPRTYPKEANHLSRVLHQYEAAFASKGIHFQSKKNSKGNMEIEITTDWLKDDIGTIKRVPIITSKT